MPALRSVDEHLSDILSAVAPLPPRAMPLADALGRTLAAPVRAATDIPAWENSAMDGFAVRYDDVAAASATATVRLRVVADIPAGSGEDPPIGPGQAARIMTGAPVPTDADTIVPFEDTAGGLGDSLTTALVRAAPRARGAHVRGRAEDATRGDIVLPDGVRLGPWQLGAAAAAGVSEVVVSPAPAVAVISTGTELRPAGEPLSRGQIPESNATLLSALVSETDAAVVYRGTVDDREESFRQAIAAALAAGAHIVVTSGGVSAGAFEVVKNTLDGVARIRFSSVAMQPGKPQGFGVLDGGALLFGLPGNPVSAAVSFEVFVRPAILRMQGRRDLSRPLLRLPAAESWRTPPGRRQYLPARIDRSDPEKWRVAPATSGGSRSHLAGALGRAEAYAVVPADVSEVAPGDLIDVLLVP